MSVRRTEARPETAGKKRREKSARVVARKGLAAIMEENLDFENGLFNLVDEDGNESAFELLGSVEIDDVTYVALVPAENEDDEYVLLKVTTDEDGSELLVTIDDDDEFDRAVAAFEEEFECEIDLDDDEDEADD